MSHWWVAVANRVDSTWLEGRLAPHPQVNAALDGTIEIQFPYVGALSYFLLGAGKTSHHSVSTRRLV